MKIKNNQLKDFISSQIETHRENGTQYDVRDIEVERLIATAAVGKKIFPKRTRLHRILRAERRKAIAQLLMNIRDAAGRFKNSISAP